MICFILLLSAKLKWRLEFPTRFIFIYSLYMNFKFDYVLYSVECQSHVIMCVLLHVSGYSLVFKDHSKMIFNIQEWCYLLLICKFMNKLQSIYTCILISFSYLFLSVATNISSPFISVKSTMANKVWVKSKWVRVKRVFNVSADFPIPCHL